MSYVPQIDPNACSAHGDCVDIAPEVFMKTGANPTCMASLLVIRLSDCATLFPICL